MGKRFGGVGVGIGGLWQREEGEAWRKWGRRERNEGEEEGLVYILKTNRRINSVGIPSVYFYAVNKMISRIFFPGKVKYSDEIPTKTARHFSSVGINANIDKGSLEKSLTLCMSFDWSGVESVRISSVPSVRISSEFCRYFRRNSDGSEKYEFGDLITTILWAHTNFW